jgi:hypothetical protein
MDKPKFIKQTSNQLSEDIALYTYSRRPLPNIFPPEYRNLKNLFELETFGICGGKNTQPVRIRYFFFL